MMAEIAAAKSRMTIRGNRFLAFDDTLDAAEWSAAGANFAAAKLQPVLSSIDPVYNGFAFRVAIKI
jgi:hypothetical protein